MPDLESQIANWRRDMLAAGIKTPVPLEELESHLREDIEQQMQSGADASLAFALAVQRLGSAPCLRVEFDKTDSVTRHSRILAVLLAALAVQLAATAGMFFWLTGVSATSGPVSLPRTPEWMLPWHAALGFAYVVFITATLCARQWHATTGRRMTRWLNWALLPLLPFGTLLGIYGLWIMHREKQGGPMLASS